VSFLIQETKNNPTIEFGFWPFSAIESTVFQAALMTALWAEPEPSLAVWSIFALDPFRHFTPNQFNLSFGQRQAHALKYIYTFDSTVPGRSILSTTKPIGVSTMKKFQTCLICLLLGGFGMSVYAQDEEQSAAKEDRAAEKVQMHEHWESMSEEERAAKREKMKAHHASMTDEEKAAMRAKMKARHEAMTPEERAARKQKMRERWESMSEEERAARKQEMRERWESMSEEERQQMHEHRHDKKSSHHGEEGQHKKDG
jgi:hypothetical protein